MGFYEQLRGLMCQNRGLLNTREQRNNGGNIRQGQLIYLFIVMFHKETAAPKEFIFAAWVWIVPVFLIAHRDIPSAQLMAPLHSNLVQYSPHQAEEARAVSDIDFTFTKHFQDGLLLALAAFCLNHFLVPLIRRPSLKLHQPPHCQRHCAVATCHRQGMDHRMIRLRYSENLTL